MEGLSLVDLSNAILCFEFKDNGVFYQDVGKVISDNSSVKLNWYR